MRNWTFITIMALALAAFTAAPAGAAARALPCEIAPGVCWNRIRFAIYPFVPDEFDGAHTNWRRNLTSFS